MSPSEQKQEEEQQQLPDNIKLITDAQVIYNSENYETRELQLPDPTGRTAWSITITKLRPNKQTRGHSDPKLVEFFMIQRGEGLVILKNQAYFVKPPMVICNHIDSWIKFINTSSTADFIFMTCMNGHYRRPDVKRS